jgi:small subunit ribosomal protein S1
LELEEGIEGLVHISEIASDRRGNPLSRFQVDDVIQAKVLNVSRQEKKIGLSIRKLEESSEKEILRSYMDNHREARSNLGDLLREEMMNLEQQSSSENLERKGVEASNSEPDAPAEAANSSDDESVQEKPESEKVESPEPESEAEEKTTRTASQKTSSEDNNSAA